MNKLRTGAGLLAVGVLFATAPLAHGAEMQTGWLPWIGCWQPIEPIADPSEPLVCFVPTTDAATVEVITLEAGAIVSRERMTVDGSQRPVDEGGCTGWERASWSADGRRAYTTSELSCEGTMRRGSGIITMASAVEWLDIQAVATGDADERAVRVIRYRAASPAPLAAAGVALPTDRALLTETARQDAASAVTVGAVQEAVAHVDAAVVEAWLIEREAHFALNAQALMALDDMEVPASVIDLMVALSNPQRFAIDRAARSGEVRPAERTAMAEQRRGYYGRYRPGSWYGPYGYLWGYDPYMLRYYGFGSGYWGWGSYYTRPPVIVITPPDSGEPSATRGRMVRGRGYTAGGQSSSGGASGTTVRSGGTSSGTSSATSGSSGSSGGSDTGRRARRSGGGGS
jgi:hypothetical protein